MQVISSSIYPAQESLQLKHSAGKLCKLSLSVLLQASSLCILSLSGTTCSVIAIILVELVVHILNFRPLDFLVCFPAQLNFQEM